MERVDHGIRSVEDPALMDRFVAEQVPLTACPLSNVRLHAVESLEEHPLARLLRAGPLVSVNSDDPAYFGGYLDDNGPTASCRATSAIVPVHATSRAVRDDHVTATSGRTTSVLYAPTNDHRPRPVGPSGPRERGRLAYVAILTTRQISNNLHLNPIRSNNRMPR